MKPLLLILCLLVSATVAAEISEPIFDPIPYVDPCAGGYHGQTVKWSCPVCGRCNPINSGVYGVYYTTVAYCQCSCCNYNHYLAFCAVNKTEFQFDVNECDQIEWGLHYILVDGDTMFYKGSFDAPSDSFLVKGNDQYEPDKATDDGEE